MLLYSQKEFPFTNVMALANEISENRELRDYGDVNSYLIDIKLHNININVEIPEKYANEIDEVAQEYWFRILESEFNKFKPPISFNVHGRMGGWLELKNIINDNDLYNIVYDYVKKYKNKKSDDISKHRIYENYIYKLFPSPRLNYKELEKNAAQSIKRLNKAKAIVNNMLKDRFLEKLILDIIKDNA